MWPIIFRASVALVLLITFPEQDALDVFYSVFPEFGIMPQ